MTGFSRHVKTQLHHVSDDDDDLGHPYPYPLFLRRRRSQTESPYKSSRRGGWRGGSLCRDPLRGNALVQEGRPLPNTVVQGHFRHSDLQVGSC